MISLDTILKMGQLQGLTKINNFRHGAHIRETTGGNGINGGADSIIYYIVGRQFSHSKK